MNKPGKIRWLAVILPLLLLGLWSRLGQMLAGMLDGVTADRLLAAMTPGQKIGPTAILYRLLLRATEGTEQTVLYAALLLLIVLLLVLGWLWHRLGKGVVGFSLCALLMLLPFSRTWKRGILLHGWASLAVIMELAVIALLHRSHGEDETRGMTPLWILCILAGALDGWCFAVFAAPALLTGILRQESRQEAAVGLVLGVLTGILTGTFSYALPSPGAFGVRDAFFGFLYSCGFYSGNELFTLSGLLAVFAALGAFAGVVLAVWCLFAGKRVSQGSRWLAQCFLLTMAVGFVYLQLYSGRTDVSATRCTLAAAALLPLLAVSVLTDQWDRERMSGLPIRLLALCVAGILCVCGLNQLRLLAAGDPDAFSYGEDARQEILAVSLQAPMEQLQALGAKNGCAYGSAAPVLTAMTGGDIRIRELSSPLPEVLPEEELLLVRVNEESRQALAAAPHEELSQIWSNGEWLLLANRPEN